MRKLIIKEISSVIELNFDSITQICGKNINIKKKIYKSLKGYFSRKAMDSDIDLKVYLDKEEIDEQEFLLADFCERGELH